MAVVYENPSPLNEIAGILQKEKPHSILLLNGENSYYASGAEKLISPQLKGYRVTYASTRNQIPSIEDVRKTITLIRENNIDFIIAVGGGKVMDIAKAAALLYKETMPIKEYITAKIKANGSNLPRILIPTTSGSGAEITPFAVVYIDKTKYSLAHPSMVPEHILLDPSLTYSLPPKITAQTGVDALAQAIEGLWSVKSTEESRQYSREAIPIILSNIVQAVNAPTPENRAAMMYAAHLAGKSIAIAKTTAAHAISYPLTAYHNIPHGHAVMLTLPYFFPINENVTPENIQNGLAIDTVKTRISELLSLLSAKDGEEARDKLISLMEQIGLETRLSRLGIHGGDL